MSYDIKMWLEKQPAWVQEAVDLIRAKGIPVDDDIKRLVSLLKGEITRTYDATKDVVTPSAPISSLRLLALENVRGIDCLQPRSPLTFGQKNLTIIYGRNGSGKSGYTRLIKRICGKGAAPLRGNVYADSVLEKTCTIRYALNGVEDSIVWQEGATSIPVGVLSSVDIFDDQIAGVYLNGEHGVAYLPNEIRLFHVLANVYNAVKNILEQEKASLQSRLPCMPREYANTPVAIEYARLMKGTMPERIEEFTSFSPKQAEEAESLQARLDAKNPSESAKKRRDCKARLDQLKKHIEKISTLSSSASIDNIRELICNAREKRRQVDDGAVALKGGSNLDGVGQSIWKTLWEAARRYSIDVVYKDSRFPYTGSGARCVLCQQELTPEAQERLKRFENFVQGELEKKAKEAEAKLKDWLDTLPILEPQETVSGRCESLSLEDELRQNILEFYKQATALIQAFKNREIPDEATYNIKLSQEIISKLEALSNLEEQRAQEFEKDAKSFNKDAIQAKLLDIRARQWVSQQRDAVVQEIERLEKVLQYNRWEKETNTSGLTREAGEATKTLVTDAYIARFNNELKKLGATHIQVELALSRNTKGESRYNIRLKNAKQSLTPIEILSDGEKRIVSLAAFLADVTGREIRVPFIFDDPISSLDQDFEENVTDRLVELSKERQVIVFTHRLSLLSLLSDKVGDGEPETICISREPWGTGNPDNFPINCKNPVPALNELSNTYIAKARKIYEEQGTSQYSIYAQSICSSFRTLIEKSVERILLADIVQRHRRAITTKGKIYNLKKIQEEDCKLFDDMMTKYSRYEHSQSVEMPIELPKPEDFEADVRTMLDWYNEFKKRK